MFPQRDPQTEYAACYTDADRARMLRQACLLEEATRDVLAHAGLGPGMRVLDFGCGMGDVSLLAAALVAPNGVVTGIDRDPRAIRSARERAGSLHAHFEVCDLDGLAKIEPLGRPFDAVIGRFVLCHQPDPAGALRKLVSVLRPGSRAVFLEPEIDVGLNIKSDFPVTTRCIALIVETLRRAGVHLNLGTQLPQVFHQAGLPWPETSTHIVMGSGPDFIGYGHWADTFTALRPLAEKLGIAMTKDVTLRGLAEEIRQEVVGKQSSLLTNVVVGAWVRRIGAHPDMLVFR